jgi:hypothetical protein
MLVKIGIKKKTSIHGIKVYQGQERASKSFVKFHAEVKETVISS